MTERESIARIAANFPNAGAYITSVRLPPSFRRIWVQAQLQAAKAPLNDGRMGVIALGHFGNIYEQMGDFEKSLSCHKLALKAAKHGGDTKNQRTSRASIGMILARLQRIEEALPYLEVPLSVRSELPPIPNADSAPDLTQKFTNHSTIPRESDPTLEAELDSLIPG